MAIEREGERLAFSDRLNMFNIDIQHFRERDMNRESMLRALPGTFSLTCVTFVNGRWNFYET